MTTNHLYPPVNDTIARVEEGDELSYPSTDFRQCRICLETDAPEDDPLIAPCRCAGSMQWVHRKCLDEWRAQAASVPAAVASHAAPSPS